MSDSSEHYSEASSNHKENFQFHLGTAAGTTPRKGRRNGRNMRGMAASSRSPLGSSEESSSAEGPASSGTTVPVRNVTITEEQYSSLSSEERALLETLEAHRETRRALEQRVASLRSRLEASLASVG